VSGEKLLPLDRRQKHGFSFEAAKIFFRASASKSSIECAQAPFNTGFVARRKAEGVKRPDPRSKFGVAAELGDLSFSMSEIEVKQDRGRLHPRVHSNGTERMKAQHALVKLYVAGIHFNDEVRAGPNTARIYIRSVEECGDNALRP